MEAAEVDRVKGRPGLFTGSTSAASTSRQTAALVSKTVSEAIVYLCILIIKQRLLTSVPAKGKIYHSTAYNPVAGIKMNMLFIMVMCS